MYRKLEEKAVGTIFMSIEDKLLKKSQHKKYNIYAQTNGILNAHEPIILARSKEPSIRFSCIQLRRHGCASNVKKAGRLAFQETSVHRIFIESCNIPLCINFQVSIFCNSANEIIRPPLMRKIFSCKNL